MGNSLDPKEAQKKIFGAWESSDGLVYFMFSNAYDYWHDPVMVVHMNKKMYSMPYRLTHSFGDANKVFLDPTVPSYPFEYGKLIVEIIDDDTIELDYYEDIYTLMRFKGNIENLFRL
jgi:hypothetical protein